MYVGVPTVERNIERFSDESSKKADSDSYLDTWTDSDPTPVNSSPPKTGNTDDKKVTITNTVVIKCSDREGTIDFEFFFFF